jgi:chloramphenicol 3-O-phosphotransferase
VGVGKTTVGDELTYVLEERGVPHTFVDLDSLTHTFPRPEGDPFGEGLAIQNLRDVWRNSAEAGSRNLIVARVVEDDGSLQSLRDAVPGAEVRLVRLRASADELRERVRRREISAGGYWHGRRSLELAKRLEEREHDRVVDTEARSPREVATELAELVRWER